MADVRAAFSELTRLRIPPTDGAVDASPRRFTRSKMAIYPFFDCTRSFLPHSLRRNISREEALTSHPVTPFTPTSTLCPSFGMSSRSHANFYGYHGPTHIGLMTPLGHPNDSSARPESPPVSPLTHPARQCYRDAQAVTNAFPGPRRMFAELHL